MTFATTCLTSHPLNTQFRYLRVKATSWKVWHPEDNLLIDIYLSSLNLHLHLNEWKWNFDNSVINRKTGSATFFFWFFCGEKRKEKKKKWIIIFFRQFWSLQSQTCRQTRFVVFTNETFLTNFRPRHFSLKETIIVLRKIIVQSIPIH